MQPRILADNFPVSDFYISNICDCFMKCDNLNVKDEVVAYVVHFWCILKGKGRNSELQTNYLDMTMA